MYLRCLTSHLCLGELPKVLSGLPEVHSEDAERATSDLHREKKSLLKSLTRTPEAPHRPSCDVMPATPQAIVRCDACLILPPIAGR